MFMRYFLSALIAGLWLSFITPQVAFAKSSKNTYTSKKHKKKYLNKKNWRKVRKSDRIRSKKRGKNSGMFAIKPNIKPVTKASLNVRGIKNLRHAKLTSRGRMSVAKDVRGKTVRSFGKRVSYKYRPGTVVVSNYTRRLYYVVRPGKVISYPIATPRPDEIWSGRTSVSKKKINPDWYPTPSMREKNPNLPEKVAGGSKYNPFGRRALYLGKSLYRIHGTNRPGSIGKSASGGCYRMHNKHIRSLFRRVKIGTPVVVLTKKRI